MKTTIKTPQFGDEQGIWIKWKDGEFHPFSLRAWDALLHRQGLTKIGRNRWAIA